MFFETVEPTSSVAQPALPVPSSGAESPRSSTAEPRSPREPSTTESKTASSPSRAEDAKLPLVHPPPPPGNPSFKRPALAFDKEKCNKSVSSSSRSEASDIDECFEMSLCSGLTSDTPLREMQARCARHIVTWEPFSASAKLTANPNLVVRMSGRYFSWQVIGPCCWLRPPSVARCQTKPAVWHRTHVL